MKRYWRKTHSKFISCGKCQQIKQWIILKLTMASTELNWRKFATKHWTRWNTINCSCIEMNRRWIIATSIKFVWIHYHTIWQGDLLILCSCSSDCPSETLTNIYLFYSTSDGSRNIRGLSFLLLTGHYSIRRPYLITGHQSMAMSNREWRLAQGPNSAIVSGRLEPVLSIVQS